MDRLNMLLINIPPYKYIDRRTISKMVASNSHREAHNKGKYLYIQGDICNSMDLIVSGGVEIRSIDKDGKTRVLSTLSKGDILGANILFSSKREYPFSVVCIEELELFKISKEEVLSFSEKNREFVEGILTIISDKTTDLTSWISNISLKTLREKIIDYLRIQSAIQESNLIYLPTTKSLLAERLGVQRTSLSRELSILEKEGRIKVKNRSILVINKENKY